MTDKSKKFCEISQTLLTPFAIMACLVAKTLVEIRKKLQSTKLYPKDFAYSKGKCKPKNKIQQLE